MKPNSKPMEPIGAEAQDYLRKVLDVSGKMWGGGGEWLYARCKGHINCVFFAHPLKTLKWFPVIFFRSHFLVQPTSSQQESLGPECIPLRYFRSLSRVLHVSGDQNGWTFLMQLQSCHCLLFLDALTLKRFSARFRNHFIAFFHILKYIISWIVSYHNPITNH